VSGFLPVGAKARDPRASESSLENEPLLVVSLDFRNRQHRFAPAGHQVSSPPQQPAQAHPPLGWEELLVGRARADAA
jgi:hypothetical protein